MATSTTKQASGLTDQIILNNGEFKINPIYEIQVTENADLTCLLYTSDAADEEL
jgi:hypothetical protein